MLHSKEEFFLLGLGFRFYLFLLDLSMEDGASTPNAAQPAAGVREHVSANALYQQMVEMIVLVRPRIIIVIQIHVPSQEQPLHRMITRETMMSKHYSD